ncbi:MAG: hypothetical protein JNJ49_06360 [Bdellovibrionaceae bacterium]|nr:hypothetical protein [Pseudobdellovibrionaceae bacterium]
MVLKQQLDIRILAIGTELTDGQVLEKNAAWLASRLTEMGYRVLEHRTVSDDRSAIEQAFSEFLRSSDGIVVTGGLGPTSDDFTRHCLAKVLGRELIWDEPSWAKIAARLSQRGIPVTENQRAQAFFPSGSEVLLNSAGTANGFWLEDVGSTRFVAVLPGPPAEIAAIWADGLAAKLKALAPRMADRKLLLFKTIGRGEGLLATETERILDDLEAESGVSRIAVGYRANVPYVELKFWLDQETVGLESSLREKVKAAFSDVLIGEGDFDFADRLLNVVASGDSVSIFDNVTEGLLLERLKSRFAVLAPLLARPVSLFAGLTYQCGGTMAPGRAGVVCEVVSMPGSQWDILLTVRAGEKETRKEFMLPGLARVGSPREGFNERSRRWAAELALRFWSENV